jgi:CubicO group peptidase (beta-lactamase class C family)
MELRLTARGTGVRMAFAAVSFLLWSCAPSREPPSETAAWPGESWPVSTPDAENVNAAVLDSIDAEIRAGEFGRLDHFLVIRHGKVIFDRHYERDYAALVVADGRDTAHHIYNYDDPRWHPYYDGTDLHTLQSVTKSVTSLALGIAMDEGRLPGVQVPAMSFFEAYAPDMSDPRRQAMTLQDLLTMRSGIDWNEEIPYDDPENTCVQLEASDDWIRFVLERPMREEPGTRFDYNSGVSVLLGKIVGVATGTRVDAWTAERLFAPLGIRDWYWKITPDGEVDTEGGLYLRPHDLARIAYLVLRNGRWKDRQVVSEAWIRESARPWVRFPDTEFGTPVGYGYQWWLDLVDGEPLTIAGSGFGGQFPVVVPEKDLVVVFNAWNNHDRPPRDPVETILTRIVPAAR